MSLYTGRGDEGKTDLYTGERRSKDHPVIHLLGTVDEIDSIIGKAHRESEKTSERLEKIQEQLFRLKSDIALEGSDKNISKEDIEWMERTIDSADKKLPEIEGFIHQRGRRPAVELFHARTVCRRAERLAAGIETDKETKKFLNRLSDLLFILGREENQGMEERV